MSDIELGAFVVGVAIGMVIGAGVTLLFLAWHER